MATEFKIPLHRFDTNLLPPEARQVGTEAFKTAVMLHFAAEYAAQGQTAMVTVDDQEVTVMAFPAESSMGSTENNRIEKAKSSTAAKGALRTALFGTKLASTFAPKLPSNLLGRVSEKFPEMVNMGALTIIANIYGNPAVSIPAGTVGGLPVGMQVLARHHEDPLLFDVALAVERERPWPMVAPAVTDAA